MSVSSVSSVI